MTAFPAACAGNDIARANVAFCLSHFSILKRHIVRKREGQRSAARPRHICQTATGLAAALPFVNRGGESRGGMRETAGKERATTIAARSWRRSPRISSPLSFLRRLPTSPLSKPHLLQATGDCAGRTNRHMGNAGPHTGERAAVEAPRGRIERAFVLMPIRGYSPHRLPQGQARQAAPWTRPLTLSPRRLSKRGALPQACGLPAFRAPSGIWGADPCDGRLNQRFRRDCAAAGYPGATGFLKKSPLSELSSESGLHFITSGSYHHPLKRLRTSLHSSAPPAAVSSSANQSRGFAPSPVSGTAAFSEAPQTVQTPS